MRTTPVDRLAPDLMASFDTIERNPPARMDPAQGKAGFSERLVPLDGAVFLPLMPAGRSRRGWVVAGIGVLALVPVVVLGWLGSGEAVIFTALLAAGLLTLVADKVTLRLARARRRASTGVLCLPDRLVIRRGPRVVELPRASIATIEERMEVLGFPTKKRFTIYRAVIVSTGGRELPLVEFVCEGEPDLSLRSNHPEGEFVGALVRYLVRSWRDGHPS